MATHCGRHVADALRRDPLDRKETEDETLPAGRLSIPIEPARDKAGLERVLEAAAQHALLTSEAFGPELGGHEVLEDREVRAEQGHVHRQRLLRGEGVGEFCAGLPGEAFLPDLHLHVRVDALQLWPSMAKG
eukprot:CAMPEP_0170616054 /NCGR_PEP_ID=MMETSP0224-20130122/25669_1 /TAXON_ID=285029 /ORGANISM="Togula jolla, Strain CCCM 725" /LENGTH=131 /DNA_ID=CAMNT_0010941833 /DNA_START=408 /DNA_END=799 /DNA_ORIENTATION=+